MTASYRAVSPCAVNPAMAARTCSRSEVSSWTTTGWSEKATTPIRVPGSILVAKASAAALARSMLSGSMLPLVSMARTTAIFLSPSWLSGLASVTSAFLRLKLALKSSRWSCWPAPHAVPDMARVTVSSPEPGGASTPFRTTSRSSCCWPAAGNARASEPSRNPASSRLPTLAIR